MARFARPGGGNCAECNPASWCDTDWPWPHGTLGAYGFDAFAYNVIVPGTTENDPHDIMSYGGPLKWISPRNWIRLFNAFTGQNLPYPKSTLGPMTPAGATPTRLLNQRAYLVVSGEMNAEGEWTLHPAYEIDLPETEEEAPNEGEYSLILRGAEGQALMERRFDLAP
ncbi:MAG: hypothetical protein GXP42_17165, partial [Chloroflexi bacterium]|nr:hypothetical protein [Chloroflexota bacterium]